MGRCLFLHWATAGLETLGENGGPTFLVALTADQAPADVFRLAAAAGCLVMRLELQTERLEDLFEQAVGELNRAHL